MTRREVGKAVGGLLLAFSLSPGPAPARAAALRLSGSLGRTPALDAWIRVAPDGTVTVFTGKVELGQGILTALAQIAADELDVAIERVRVVSADTARTPDEGYTAGSMSVETSGAALRQAAAEVRRILLDLAAERLSVPVERLEVDDGAITVRGSGTRTSYWALANDVRLHREATGAARPKPPSRHRLVGRSVPRLDIPRKVTGGASYVHDLRLPGMLFGRVCRPPSFGARLLSVDEAAVRAMPGVVALVRDGDFLAVAAEREEQAIAAVERLRQAARWREAPTLPEPAAIHDYLKALPATDTVVGEKNGAAPPAVRWLTATYRKPYLAHASMGPSCAVAQFRDGTLTVWTHSQGPFPLRRELATVLRLPESRIRVVHTEGAGCYGHNGADDAALDAALLARATSGRPVKLQWMRDDEFGWEPLGPAMTMTVRAGLDAAGSIVDWTYELWSPPHSTRPGGRGGSNLLAAWHLAEPLAAPLPVNVPQPAGASDRNAVPLYDFPRQRVVNHFLPRTPIRTSALRTLGAYANVFAIESFMDELAAAAGADPVEFRLRHLGDERAKAVIRAAADRAAWRPGETGDGRRGRGVGFARYKNLQCYVAVIADVEVDRASGEVRVPQIVAAVDAGQVVNPDGLVNQIEGGIVQSTSWTLKEQVTFDRQRVTSRDWNSYPILTFPEVPRVDVVVLNRPDERPLGAGEGSQAPTAAAIANAVFHATGTRVRDLPITPEKLRRPSQ
ncbi:MAG TPA: molybdopterin cofactor-binding domain-containing protein [Thermodesulfobacteriota bacterium]